jgi:hypothetical protein
MATYKTGAGQILQPGAQINRLSSFNTEAVFGWPGIACYEAIGYNTVTATSATNNPVGLDVIIPSPDRRTDDRVRDNITGLTLVGASSSPIYVYGASIAVAQDIPAGTTADPAPGFPADPVTADLQFTNATDFLLFGPANGAVPFGIPNTQANGLAAATSYLQASSSTIAQGSTATTAANGVLPFTTAVSGTIANTDFANSMMYKVTTPTTWKIFNTTAVSATNNNGGGYYISTADNTAGKKAYIITRLNYIKAAPGVSWNDIQGFIDFASQVGGDDG